METISIIIPNYNGIKLLQNNIPEVIKFKNKYSEIVEIIVVDDKSTDNSLEFIKNHYPEVKIVNKRFNSGFSSSVNLGVKESNGSLIFLLNTDVKPKLNIIPFLLSYFKYKDTFAVGCLDYSIENGKVIKRGRGIGFFHKGFLMHKKGEIDKNNTLWVSGGSSIFRKSIWNILGGFDEIFDPFYWEDIDISYRALKSGYKIFFESCAEVIHEHKRGAITNHYNQRYIEEISLRNQILFVWKNISDIYFLTQHFIYQPYYLITSVLSWKFSYISSFIKAMILVPKIMASRFTARKTWVKKDREILQIYRDEFYNKNK